MLATDVGGEGRNLQFANVLVNYDLPWNPMKIEQRIGRLHRIGQTREVRIFSLCARGSAEERILDVLDRRIHLFELVIGEVDFILGRALGEKEFDDRIFAIYEGARTDEELALRFEGLASELAGARGHYEKVKGWMTPSFAGISRHERTSRLRCPAAAPARCAGRGKRRRRGGGAGRELGAELGLEEHASSSRSRPPARASRLRQRAPGADAFRGRWHGALRRGQGGGRHGAGEAGARRRRGPGLPQRGVLGGRRGGCRRIPRDRACRLHPPRRRAPGGTVRGGGVFDTLGVVAGFEDAVGGALEALKPPAPEPARLLDGALSSLSACSRRATEAAAGFREGMERRLLRDRERLVGYFADLLAELERRTASGRSEAADAHDKRQALERERLAKLEALSVRYVMRVEVRLVALLLVEAPIYRVAVDLRRRKASRTVELEFDCLTRQLAAPTCEGCGAPAPRPAACDDAVHLLCEACAPKSDGRATCGACRRKCP